MNLAVHFIRARSSLILSIRLEEIREMHNLYIERTRGSLKNIIRYMLLLVFAGKLNMMLYIYILFYMSYLYYMSYKNILH